MGRNSSFLLFFLLLTIVFGLLQWYVSFFYRRWVCAAFLPAQQSRWMRIGRWILIAGNVLFLTSFSARWLSVYTSPLWKMVNLYPAGLYFAIIVTGLLFAVASDAARFVTYWVRRARVLMQRLGSAGSTSVEVIPAPPMSDGRRKFLRMGGYAAMGVSFGAPIIASLTTSRDYQMNRLTLRFPQLPAGLDGFTIAHLSDLHSGVYMSQEHLHEIFGLAQSYGAQMIVVTGDFVDANDQEIEPLDAELSILKAEYGVWGCLGNHDHFASAEKVNAALEQRGIIMLNNGRRIVEVNGAKLAMMGIDDFGRAPRNFARPDAAFDSIDPEAFRLLLSHRPEFFPEAKARGVDLQLSGHTHGGQVGFDIGPLKLNPVYLVHKYAKGLYVEGNQQIFVNVGVGMVGAPVRIVRPEIALLTLRKG